MEKYENITLEDAQILMSQSDANLADIRDLASFQTGHIDGAKHLSNDNLQDFIRDADLDKPLIVYCFHGHSSQSAAQFLLEQGFDEVYSLIGGYAAYENQQAK